MPRALGGKRENSVKRKGRPAPKEGTTERGDGARDGPSSPNVATLSPRVNVEPVRDLVLIRPEAPKALQSALIEVVDFTPKAAIRGKVVAVGPEVRDVRTGQQVLFSKLQGYEVMGYILLAEGAVLATF